MRIFALPVLLWIAHTCNAQEKQAHPGYAPTLLLASASAQEGQVVIQMSRPGPVLPPEDRTEERGDRHRTEWVYLREVTLGKTVQAFGVDGLQKKPKAVLEALAKPKGVAVFIRNYASDPLTPALFYRALLREGTIILVVNAEDIYYAPP